MKKFVFLYRGYGEPTREVMDAWSSWFASVADKMVDMGHPLGPGREISGTGGTGAGSRDLPVDAEAIAGYSIVHAADLDEAEKIAQGCPIVTSVTVYEAMSM